MLVKITSKRGDRPSSSGPRGLTYCQQALCNAVWEMKARVNADPEHCAAHPAIRQFQLERWVWERFCKLCYNVISLLRRFDANCYILTFLAATKGSKPFDAHLISITGSEWLSQDS